jgi:RNA polymerase sigma factor (TIGR02999 family)
MSEVTRLLDAAAAGDRRAAADLLPLVYDELRRLAAARMAAEPPGHTLDATALVHEAYVRLVGPVNDDRWDGRGHFFAAAAEAMRRILVEAARRKQAEKHGGGKVRVPLEAVDGAAGPAGPDERLVALDSALTRLGREQPEVAEVVNLRYFAGLKIEQAAAALGVSVRTANRHWAFAKAWLYRELGPGG